MARYAGNTSGSDAQPLRGSCGRIFSFVFYMVPYAGIARGLRCVTLRGRRRRHRFLCALHGAVSW